MHKTQFSEAILNLISTSSIMVIAFYLLACSIAPLVNLNNQTFKIVVTLTGAMPTVFFYLKDQVKN